MWHQLSWHSSWCVGPWSGQGGRRMGRVQGGLAELPGLAALLASVIALAACPANTFPLTRSTFISPCRAQQNRTSGNVEGIKRGERAPLKGGRAQARRGSWLGRGVWLGAGCPRNRQCGPSTIRLPLSALPGGDRLHYLGCNPLFLFASQALLPS